MSYNELLAQRVSFILKDAPGLEEKKMFGGVGYLVNGNMACGVNGNMIIVRMSENDAAEALKQPNVYVFDMTGRPMKGWITVDSSSIEKDQDLKAWIDRGLQHAKTLPPK